MSLLYRQEQNLAAAEYIACVGQTALGPTRPLGNSARVQAYIDGSNLVITARTAEGSLVGLLRGMTDWHWVCYCADLAVAKTHQGQGIGEALIDKAGEILGSGVSITLFSIPTAESFYQKIGFSQTSSAFFRDRTDRS